MPELSRTYPEITPGRSVAQTGIDNPNKIAQVPRFRSLRLRAFTLPTPVGNPGATRYSTANSADGLTVCFEILSFTLISILYVPGCRFAATIDFCSVTCSPTLPIVSVLSVFCTTCLLVARLVMSYSNVAEGLCVFSSTPRL